MYFQLGREDHRWWWRSFCSGGSTGLFVYAFSFFYFRHSEMDGLLQVRGLGGLLALGWPGAWSVEAAGSARRVLVPEVSSGDPLMGCFQQGWRLGWVHELMESFLSASFLGVGWWATSSRYRGGVLMCCMG